LFYRHFKLSLHFCTFSRNAPANCLFFSNGIMNSDISCVALTNNSCQSDPEDPGLIYVLSTVAMSNCVFQSNTFDYFLGSSRPSGGDITFINCVFDFPSLNETGSVSFTVANYIYELQPTSLADCTHTRSDIPYPSPTATRSQTPAQSPVSISETGHSNIPLQNGNQLTMNISTHPMFVILPALSNLMARVYDSTGDETVSFSTPTNVLAVYFSQSNGRIVFTATGQTTLKYFAIKPPFDCAVYFVSSSPNEIWGAGRSDGNFTIRGWQDVCLLHVSDNATDVAVKYNTQEDIDFLDFEYSGTRSGNYTGSGSVSDSANYFSAFRWHQGPHGKSTSFSVRLSSPRSSLPSRTASGSGTAPSAILLEAVVPTPPTAVPGRSSGGLSGGSVAAIVVGCVALIVVLVIVLCKVVAVRSARREEVGAAIGLYAAAPEDPAGAWSERQEAVPPNRIH
jgi:hypothetical protein